MGGGTGGGTGGGSEVLAQVLEDFKGDHLSSLDHGYQAIANSKIEAARNHLESPPSDNRLVRFFQKLTYRHNLGQARLFTRGTITFEYMPPTSAVEETLDGHEAAQGEIVDNREE
jgi:hypothetical protein